MRDLGLSKRRDSQNNSHTCTAVGLNGEYAFLCTGNEIKVITLQCIRYRPAWENISSERLIDIELHQKGGCETTIALRRGWTNVSEILRMSHIHRVGLTVA